MAARSSFDDLVKITNCNWSSFYHYHLVSRQDLEIMTLNFSLLSPVNDKIDRSHFRDLLTDQFGMDDSLLMDRGRLVLFFEEIVFRAFDTDSDNYIGFDEFIRGMSIFLKGRLEERMKCKI